MVTTAKQWKKGSKGLQEITLPSGNVAKLKAPGMEAFLVQGFIPNNLLNLVMKQLNVNSGKRPTDKDEEREAKEFMDQIREDPTKLAELLDTMDKVAVHCMVEPTVELPPDDPKERDEAQLYVDEVDFDDKMFIFQFAVGGTKDLEQFRTGLAANVDVVQDKPRAVPASKRTTRRKPQSQ